MWKINISMEDADKLSSLLGDYHNSLEAEDSEQREKVAVLKAKLDDLLVVVREENRIVNEYINQIKDASAARLAVAV